MSKEIVMKKNKILLLSLGILAIHVISSALVFHIILWINKLYLLHYFFVINIAIATVPSFLLFIKLPITWKVKQIFIALLFILLAYGLCFTYLFIYLYISWETY